eukprot:Gb_40428 [translate_table: standard]
MPGLMKNNQSNTKASGRMSDASRPAVAKSKLKRIFERQFPNVLRNSTVESPSQLPHRLPTDHPPLQEASRLHSTTNNFIMGRTASNYFSSSGSDHDPSSVCLAEMVHDFMENGEKTTKCGRARCNCLNGHCNRDANADNEDDTKSSFGSGEVCEILKSLIPCVSLWERNLLADTSKFVEAVNLEANTTCKDKEECSNGCLRRAIMNRLRTSGYNAAICKSRWDHACGYPAGEHEYLDVILEGPTGKSERILVDIDFRSQFEIARSTSHYATVLHMLPVIFVGKTDRLQQIIYIISDAAKQSLKKKGLHIPPWRKSEYMRAKWLSPYKRTTNEVPHMLTEKTDVSREITSIAVKGSGWGSRFTSEFELKFHGSGVLRLPMKEINVRDALTCSGIKENNGKRNEEDQITVVVTEWQPPAVKPKTLQKGGKIAAGLASVLREAGLTSKS